MSLFNDLEIRSRISIGRIVSLETWAINSPTSPTLKLFLEVNTTPRNLDSVDKGRYIAPARRA